MVFQISRVSYEICAMAILVILEIEYWKLGLKTFTILTFKIAKTFNKDDYVSIISNSFLITGRFVV